MGFTVVWGCQGCFKLVAVLQLRLLLPLMLILQVEDGKPPYTCHIYVCIYIYIYIYIYVGIIYIPYIHTRIYVVVFVFVCLFVCLLACVCVWLLVC